MVTWREQRHEDGVVYWRRLMAACGGNVPTAARIAGISGSHVYRLLIQYRRSLPVNARVSLNGAKRTMQELT